MNITDPFWCECGCGGTTARVVRRLNKKHLEVAISVGWSELMLVTMRETVALIEGHESPRHVIEDTPDQNNKVDF